jgi:hypothetical protein
LVGLVSCHVRIMGAFRIPSNGVGTKIASGSFRPKADVSCRSMPPLRLSGDQPLAG